MKKGKMKQHPDRAWRRGPSNVTIAEVLIFFCILALAAVGYATALWFK